MIHTVQVYPNMVGIPNLRILHLENAITYKNSITAAVVILRFRVFSFHGIFAKLLFNELPSANKNNADYLLVCTNMIKVYKQIGRQPMVDAALQNIGAK